MKRIISVLLVLLLVFSVFSVNIAAVSVDDLIQKSGEDSNIATITVKDQGEVVEVRKVAVGDTINIKYYMNVNNVTEGNTYKDSPAAAEEDSQGYLENIDARILFDNTALESSFSSKYKEKTFPIFGKGGITINPYDTKSGGLNYNASSIGWDYCFDSDDCVLFDITFTVLKAGETTIESKIKDMQPLTNNANEYLCKGWEVNDQWDKNIVIKSDPLKQEVEFIDVTAPADGLTTGIS